MGIPKDALAFTAKVFNVLSVEIETRWGTSPHVVPNKGFVQGSVSGPARAQPAQFPILSIRAQSSAHYTTSHGRHAHAAGFVDDTEHYGNGIEDLITILKELSIGSHATGIGFSWAKFTAYATDWDDAASRMNTPIFPNGIKISGWDIRSGGTIEATVPRAHADTIEKLFGKRSSILHRHNLAALDTTTKIQNIRSRAATIRTSLMKLQ